MLLLDLHNQLKGRLLFAPSNIDLTLMESQSSKSPIGLDQTMMTNNASFARLLVYFSQHYPSPLACNDKPLMRFDKHLFVVVAREPEHGTDTIPAIDCGALRRFQAINRCIYGGHGDAVGSFAKVIE
jgi:hypothetical protein